jgi:ABC-type branched-subunit amino acid transport system substrate-binding protein/class 3 adenylate cyclase
MVDDIQAGLTGDQHQRRSGSTRGFVFADLRGYSQYVEAHGAAASAELLDRYRMLVRAAVGEFDGTEIQTEGDSFFVVFNAVSAAVRCAMAIAARAREASTAAEPIRVGIGIHAGETVETGESYIGSGVNIAARICAQARPGEVLVSETVRALTRNVLDVGFEPRGRPRLKGITERIPLYAVTERAALARRPLSGRRVAAAAAVALAIVTAGVAAVWVMSQPAAGLPPGEWKVGLVTTLSGYGEKGALYGYVVNAVNLAIDELNDNGGIHGRPLNLVTLDDRFEEELPGDLTQTLVDDPAVLAMVGPYTSGQSLHAAPISNAAGLLQCSPTNTDPALTKPRYGARDLRGSDPDRISFIRVAPADDIQAKALATFAFVDLHVSDVLIVDDGDLGQLMADLFGQEFENLGGKVTPRTLNEGADAMALLEPIFNGSNPPDAVFFSGATWGGGPQVRRAMADLGQGDKPLLAWDAMLDGPGSVPTTYIDQTGAELAAGTYASQSSLPDAKFSFVEAYRERFGAEPDQWAAGAYTCIQIFIDALRNTAYQNMSAAQLREAVRAYAVDPERQYETVIGNIGFDQNGDNIRQFVAIFRVDPASEGGLGNWVLVTKKDYGPAP